MEFKVGRANSSHDILLNMFDRAMVRGNRPETAGNSCTGITCYRRPPCRRLLGADDLAKHGKVAPELPNSLTGTAFGEWMVCRNGGDEPLNGNDLRWFGRNTLGALGIVADARRDDLRPARASRAVMNRKSLHVAGHRRASTMDGYVDLDDATVSQAAERLAHAMIGKSRRDTNQPFNTGTSRKD